MLCISLKIIKGINNMKKIVFLLSLISINIYSIGNFLDGVFINPVSTYFDMDMEANNSEYPVLEEFIEDILEVLSGRIYGWKFKYIPSDIKREITEEFNITPVAMIKWGDSRLKFKDNWIEEYIMYQNIVYTLEDFQKKRINSWHTAVIPDSYGEGTASIHEENGKSNSLKEALKDSIKREFQSRGKGKPRIIEGEILLEENPRVFINSGTFNTHVEVLIHYKNIEEYKYH